MVAELAVWTCTLLVHAEAKPASPPPKTKIKLVAVEKAIIEATNSERVRYGLPPLEVDEELMQSAREHCTWMSRTGLLRHTSLPVAENIAMGQETTDEVLRSWMRSPGHRANILHSGYRKIGVAASRTSAGVMFWCQQFRR